MVMGWLRGSVRGLSCVVGGDGAWGISSSVCCRAFASCSSALMVAKTSWGGGCRIIPGDVVLLGVLGDLLYGDGGGGIVLRCPSVWIVVEGWRVMVWRSFQLWNARRARRLCLVSPGGQG